MDGSLDKILASSWILLALGQGIRERSEPSETIEDMARAYFILNWYFVS